MRGLERGLERAFQRLAWNAPTTAAYVEIEAFICWNLVKQMEQGVLASAPIWSNIKTFNGEPFRGKIHGIIGGYPCQPFSVAGKQIGEEDPRHLWPYIAEGIRTIKPLFCFFENVRNHLNIGYDTVRAELQEIGYDVREGIYSAEEVGAPHRRDRLFILAIMGHSDRNGNENRYAFRSNTTITRKSENESQQRQWPRPEPTSTSETMADTNNSGSLENIEQSELRTDSTKQSSEYSGIANEGKGNERRLNRWPARPGQQQYEWEEPRIKCRMGFSAHGYNFREDLLRMAGNAVVEQTAEIAFIDLLKKHLKTTLKQNLK